VSSRLRACARSCLDECWAPGAPVDYDVFSECFDECLSVCMRG